MIVMELRNGGLAKDHDTSPWMHVIWSSQDVGHIYWWECGMYYQASRTLDGGQTWESFPWVD